ncbi:hypothetical protein GGQ73_003765 [Rhizobium skierniewicense]|uniref:Uncharacterized protein n=1 Tax=Rhizobium skierniewicense TaxID=984260 RepID=A0A7W6G3Q0_9HYPH|nr:hypothetical protein [Rhizobium skierniewicense]
MNTSLKNIWKRNRHAAHDIKVIANIPAVT